MTIIWVKNNGKNLSYVHVNWFCPLWAQCAICVLKTSTPRKHGDRRQPKRDLIFMSWTLLNWPRYFLIFIVNFFILISTWLVWFTVRVEVAFKRNTVLSHVKMGAGDMPQWLRGSSRGPGFDFQHLQSGSLPSPGGSGAFFWPPQALHVVHRHTQAKLPIHVK